MQKPIKLIFLLTILFLFNNCSNHEPANNNNSYTLNFISETPITGKIVLRQVIGQNTKTIDTLILENKVDFAMSGKLPETGLYLLQINDKDPYLFVIDSATISFQIDKEGNYNSKGSEAHNDFVSIIDYQKSYQSKMDSLNRAYILESNLNHIENVKSIDIAFKKVKQNASNDIKKWIYSHNPGIAGAFAGGFFNPELDMPFLDSLTTYLEPAVSKSTYVADFVKNIKKLRNSQEGGFAPNFKQNTHDGRILQLADFKGKIVLLDFWASWCGPCRNSNPDLVKLYKKYKDKNFTVFSVSLDEDVTKWKKAISDDGLEWTNHVSDLKGWENEVAVLYNVESIPQTFLLDVNGKIVAKNLHGQDLENKIIELSQKNQAN
ncbi:MAG: TlpA disulfide reductase family protein [Bacteroidota bacterium]|nr:TlpA disulfide reductase family protein [Bacteroidota bacterium]